MSFDTITPVLPHIEAGKPRLLAATTVKRSSARPDVPTLAESGLAGFDIGTWFGVLAPAANAEADGPADQGRDRQVRQARQTGQRRHRIAHRPKAPRNASCQGFWQPSWLA
jgi:tripartite-type tricarboxylate transporter receptor subunit TctC